MAPRAEKLGCTLPPFPNIHLFRTSAELDKVYLRFQRLLSDCSILCSETEACRMFFLCFFCRKYPPLDPTMNHCISLEWVRSQPLVEFALDAAPCQLVAGVVGLPNGLAMGCPMLSW